MSDALDTMDDDGSDDVPDTSGGDDSSDDSAPGPAAAPTASPQMDPALAAYLQNKQNSQAGQAGLAAAQSQASNNALIAGLAKAGSTLAQSGYGHTAPVDTSGADALAANANAPVKNFLAQQEEAKADPNSPQSKAVQGMIARLYPGKFTPDQLAMFSANDADSIYKPLELDEKIKAQASAHQDALDEKADRADTKDTDNQNKAYTAMRKDLESFRGNQSMQQAALAVQNSDKALAIAQSVPTSQNLSLLADEMGKIATGGVPGEGGTKALMPDNLYTKIAQMKAWVTGNPNASAADVSQYIQNNKDYINQVRGIAAQGLHDYRTNVAKGYKNRVAPDDYQSAVDDYGLGGGQSNSGQSGSSQAPPQYTADVINYAKAHGLTPDQAQAIKNQRGGK